MTFTRVSDLIPNLSLLRFRPNSRKVKFVVSGMCPDQDFPVKFTDFQVWRFLIDIEADIALLAGCPPLPSLGQERFPDSAEEESEEREGDLHLHGEEAGAAGAGGGGEAANLTERLQQPPLSQVTPYTEGLSVL